MTITKIEPETIRIYNAITNELIASWPAQPTSLDDETSDDAFTFHIKERS